MNSLRSPTRRLTPLLAILAGFLAASGAAAAEGEIPTAAIFVENRAGADFDDKTALLEDLITARITELGYSVLSREIVLDAIAGDPDGDGNPDRLLSNRTSAARLAQAMNADTLLAVSISSWGQNQRRYRGHNVETLTTENVLRVTYRLFDTFRGGSLLADTVRVSLSRRTTPDLNVDEGDLQNELLDRAASQLARALAVRTVEDPPETLSERPEPVPFHVDLSLRNLRIPNLHVDAEGLVTLSETEHEMAPRGVTVELDGVVAGSAPGSLEARPGLHRMRLSRDGFADWERTVNIYENFHLDIALEPSDEGLARWREYTEFLEDLRTGARLTEAEIEVLRGRAEQLRQSGFRVDIRVDTDEGLRIENRYESPFPRSER